MGIGIGVGLAALSAVFAGLFGLQYTTMKRYSVSNATFLSMLFATVIAPPIFVTLMLPQWPEAVGLAGWKPNLLMMACGFAWGCGAITYAYGFNILGMALAAALIKGISIAVGSGKTLFDKVDLLSSTALAITIAGLGMLLIGTALGGRAGVLRESELNQASSDNDAGGDQRTTSMFFWGFISCLVSGVFSAGVALGWSEGEPLDKAMAIVSGQSLEDLAWKAAFVRWLPIYFGGFLAAAIFMGTQMMTSGDWRNYVAQGSRRDFFVAATMGVVHLGAHLSFGLSTYYLGDALGNSVGFALHIALALLVAAGIGFFNGEWTGVSPSAKNWLHGSILILVIAVAVLSYGTYVQFEHEADQPQPSDEVSVVSDQSPHLAQREPHTRFSA